MRAEIVFVLILVPGLHGFCFRTFGRIDKTASGRLIPVCEYNGLDILDGSSFSTAACMECVCADGVLACCGYGINGPKVDPPPGCKAIADGCQVLIVQIGNENLDCYTGEPITLSNNLYTDPFGFDLTGNTNLQGGPNQVVSTNYALNEPAGIAGITGMSTFSQNVKVTPQDMVNGAAGGLPIDMNMLNMGSGQTVGDPSMQSNSIFNDLFGQTGTGETSTGGADTNTVVAGSLSNTNGTDTNFDVTSNTTDPNVTDTTSTNVVLGVNTSQPPTRPAVTRTAVNNMWDMLMNQIMTDPSLVDPAFGVRPPAIPPVTVPDTSRTSNIVLGSPGIPMPRRGYTEPPPFFSPSDPNTFGNLFLMSKFGDFGF